MTFRFNGKVCKGFEGDTVASALLANGQQLVGRSFKYHRPRGLLACGPEEPNALFMIGDGKSHRPNQVGTMIELRDGMVVQSQNHWPSLEMDLGSVSNLVSNFIPAGFYYKTFIAPKKGWEVLYEPAIRQSAGLGQVSKARDSDIYEHFYVHVDVLIVGGGIAGLLAAKMLSTTGLQILLVEQTPFLGGRYALDHEQPDASDSPGLVQKLVDDLSSSGTVRIRTRTTLVGAFDHDFYIAEQTLSYARDPSNALSKRLWKIRAAKVLMATGAIERPLCFAGNDIPGVCLASAVRDYVNRFAVTPGDRTVVITNNDDGYRTALKLVDSGLSVPIVLDARNEIKGSLPELVRKRGVKIVACRGIGKVRGQGSVKGVDICSQVGEGKSLGSIECEAVAMSGGWSPAVHIWSHCQGKLNWDEENSMFVPDWNNPPINAEGEQRIFPIGSANGHLLNHAIQKQTVEAVGKIAKVGNFDIAALALDGDEVAGPIKPAWLVPEGMPKSERRKSWVDFQNDVKVSDVELAIQEGFESIEHTKRYTTLGMATDQGKTSNVNGLALVAGHLGVPIPQVGTTTFRPPYSPIVFGSVAGEATGDLFKPTRKTPLDSWHEAHGAYWEPVADWRRPYCYQKEGEKTENAVQREALRVRTSVGIIDASTLGKLLVRGKDAGRFLDMVYTNVMSNLKPGKCRYGLMCDENGFLMDDGVVACLTNDTFLCHTTTGGADSIHAWMEEWLQCEWWDWEVYVANLTEEYVQIGIAGPDSRKLLEKVGGTDLDRESFPFMNWQEGILSEFKVRIFRISFSGELSFEVAVKASQGLSLWEQLLEAGKEFSIEPYGTEALHVLRAEKGFIMIGDETDGTVTPQDLGLDWAVSKKKADFIGKRGQQRTFLSASDRWQFVGLEVLNYKEPLPHGVYAQSDTLSEYGHPQMEGRVTSSYFSPILNRPIALGLVENGTERMGEVINFNCDGKLTKAKIVNPVAYDPERTQIDG